MYRLVDTGAWDDPWFSDQSPDGKLLFLYLLTNRRTNSVGSYEITVRQITFETGMPSAVVERLLVEMHPKVQWWPEHNIVWVRNFYGKQNNGEKIEINAKRIVADLPPEIRKAVGVVYPTLSYKEDTPSIPHAYPSHKQNSNVTEQDLTETGTEHNTTAPAARVKGYPPEFEEFWQPCPRKEPSKAKAYESWEKAVERAAGGAGEIQAGLERHLPVWALFEDQSKLPHVTTWLNQDRWTVLSPTGPARASPPQKPIATDLLRDAGRRVQERHDERRRDQPGARNDQYPLLANGQHGQPQRGSDDRDLDDGARGHPIDAVYRERS